MSNDEFGLMDVPDVGHLPSEYASTIRKYIEEFNSYRRELTAENRLESAIAAYRSVKKILRYSKYRSGEEFLFLDDVPELKTTLAVGLDQLNIGMMNAKRQGTITDDEYIVASMFFNLLKDRILEYKPKESTWKKTVRELYKE